MEFTDWTTHTADLTSSYTEMIPLISLEEARLLRDERYNVIGIDANMIVEQKSAFARLLATGRVAWISSRLEDSVWDIDLNTSLTIL